MWQKNGKGKPWLGNYEYDREGKRVFKLKNPRNGREIQFDSWQDAQKNNWVKVRA